MAKDYDKFEQGELPKVTPKEVSPIESSSNIPLEDFSQGELPKVQPTTPIRETTKGLPIVEDFNQSSLPEVAPKEINPIETLKNTNQEVFTQDILPNVIPKEVQPIESAGVPVEQADFSQLSLPEVVKSDSVPVIKQQSEEPSSFTQEMLPKIEKDTNPIVEIPSGVMLGRGEFISPNYKKGMSGWKINSNGQCEFSDGTFRGRITASSITTNQQEITVETTESISAAITELGSSGGTIRLKAGTYVLTDDINIPSNVTLRGQGMGVTILYFATLNKGIKCQGSSNYSTGTVSINNNSTSLTGAGGTAWLTNITTNHKIRLDNYWYDIYSVDSDNGITLSSKYIGSNIAAATYDSAIMVEHFFLEHLTVAGSGGNGIYINYGYYFFLDNVASVSNVGDGVSINNSTSYSCRYVNCFDNGSDGMYFNQVDHMEGNVIWCLRNTSKGLNGTKIYDSNIVSLLCKNNVDGAYIDTMADSVINASDCSNNSGKGVEMTTCSTVFLISNEFQNNGSDGVKLTANCDNIIVNGNSLKENGGYGINIANSNDDDNILSGNVYSSNVSGEVNDAGTGTKNDLNFIDSLGSIYGNGADGDVTIASGTTTITRDMYYNILTLANGAILNSAGYQIFVKTELIQQGTGKIVRTAGGTGGNASGKTGGSAGSGVVGYTVPSSNAGVSGGAGSISSSQGGAGNNGTAATNSIGGNGVTLSGGSGQGGGGISAGVNGSAGVATASVGNILDYHSARVLGIFLSGSYVQFSGNAGNPTAGGGGGGYGTPSGNYGGDGGGSGGSGGNGGWIVVFAQKITVNPGVVLFEAKGGTGGNGGNGTNATSACYNGYGGGGGGAGAYGLGGNGGIVVVIYSKKSGTITYDLSAGANGSNGTPGLGYASCATPGSDGAVPDISSSGLTGQSVELII